MGIKQRFTPEDFEKLTLPEFHVLWYHRALTDRKIAKLFGVTKARVKEYRKENKMKMMSSAILAQGNPKFKKGAAKDWLAE